MSIAVMIAVWWILAETYFRRSAFIPAPPEVVRQMGIAARSGALWVNTANTLWKAIAAFFISLGLGIVCAVAAAWDERIRHFFSPVVTVIRAVPTMGVVLVLFMVFRHPEAAAVVIAFMMIFPMVYEGFYTAIKEIDGKLLEMAKIHKIPFRRQILGIYIPHIAPYFFSAARASIGMSLKVVIAAEIIGIPVANTLGTAMFNARQTMTEHGLIFMWIFVAVIVSFVLEAGIRVLGKLCMPWKR